MWRLTMSKNNVDKRLDPNPKLSKDNISKEIKVAKKDVMELDLDALDDVLSFFITALILIGFSCASTMSRIGTAIFGTTFIVGLD